MYNPYVQKRNCISTTSKHHIVHNTSQTILVPCCNRVQFYFQNFVHKQQLFQNYDKTYSELAKRAETYRRVAGKPTFMLY